jgi:threonine/homoserine/homoserine lactone efflux protein
MTIGILFGLSAGFAPGPLLTLVINQTLRHSTTEGVKVALAPIITDVPIVLASLFVLTKLNHYERILGMISLMGGLYVLYLAYENFRIERVNIRSVRD